MSKIGIKINNISAGLAVAYQANTNISNWALKTHDTRDDLRNLGFTDGAGNFVPFLVSPEAQTAALYMLSFDMGGCYLCSIKMSSGRMGDHVASWFYFPREADVPAPHMRQLIQIVDAEVMTGGLINEQRLNDVFLNDFPNRPVLPVYANSNQSAGYAVRYYGRGTDYSLEDLLGHDIYQPEYAKYKAIFLIDKASGLTCRGAVDLTSRRLARTVTVMPPQGDSFGFSPFLDNKPFVEPMMAYQGTTLQLVWRKNGFKDVVKPVTLKSDPQLLPGIQESEMRWIVPYAHFNVIDENGRSIPNCNITIFGKPLTPDSLADVPFAELKRGVRVKVTKEGYAEKVVDYQGAPIDVNMEKLTQRYVFLFPEGEKVTLSGNKTFIESPFKGYTANQNNSVSASGQNRLYKVAESFLPGGLNLKSLLIGGVAGAILVGAAWLALSLFGGSKTVPEPQEPEKPVVEKPEKPKQLPKFEVLNAPVWNKQVLEDAGFTGLWDGLNKYDFPAVMSVDSKYPELQQQVPQWNDLRSAILALQQTGANIYGTFNGEGDEDITVANYINKIKKNTFNNGNRPKAEPVVDSKTEPEKVNAAKGAEGQSAPGKATQSFNDLQSNKGNG